MGIINSVENLIAAIFEFFGSIVKTIISTIVSAIESVLSLFGIVLKDIVGFTEAIFRFLLSNIVTIGVLIGAFVLYSVYQRNQGRPVAAQQGKKTN